MSDTRASRAWTDLFPAHHLLATLLAAGILLVSLLDAGVHLSQWTNQAESNWLLPIAVDNETTNHTIQSDYKFWCRIPVYNKTNSSELPEEPTPVPENNEDFLILDAYLWAAVLTPIPAGHLADVWGTKWLFGGGTFVVGLLGLLFPVATAAHSPSAVAIRGFQGACAGVLGPALMATATRWAPNKRKARFVSLYLVSGVGTALALLMGSSYLNMLCYVVGCLSMAWFILWVSLVFDSPARHPRLSEAERKELDALIKAPHDKVRVARVPWLKLLSSRVVWAVIVSVFGLSWCSAVVSYSSMALFNTPVGSTQIFFAVPYLLRGLLAIPLGYLADKIRNRGIADATTVSKFFVYVAHFLPGACLLLSGYVGCDMMPSAILFGIATVIGCAAGAGSLATCVLALPNYAGTVFGIAQTLAIVARLSVAVIVRNVLTPKNLAAWRALTGCSGVLVIVSGAVFLCLASARPQPWADLKVVHVVPETDGAQMNGEAQNHLLGERELRV